MRAVRAAVRLGTDRDEPCRLFTAQSIPRLDRRLAGFHVEDISKRRLPRVIDLSSLDPAHNCFVAENLRDEHRRVDTAFEQEHGKRLDGERSWTRWIRLDPKPLKQRDERLKGDHRFGRHRNGQWNEETLLHQVAFGDPPPQFREHHTLMERMLIRDDDATGIRVHDPGVVHKQHINGVRRRREQVLLRNRRRKPWFNAMHRPTRSLAFERSEDRFGSWTSDRRHRGGDERGSRPIIRWDPKE